MFLHSRSPQLVGHTVQGLSGKSVGGMEQTPSVHAEKALIEQEVSQDMILAGFQENFGSTGQPGY